MVIFDQKLLDIEGSRHKILRGKYSTETSKGNTEEGESERSMEGQITLLVDQLALF